MRNSKTAHSAQPSFLVLPITALVLANMLLPLDRGFPGVTLVGGSIHAGVVLSAAAFIWVMIGSRGKVISRFLSDAVAWQAAFVMVLIVGTGRSAVPLAAVQRAALYACTFWVNLAVLTYAVERGLRPTITRIVVLGGSLAAAIGILEGLAGVTLPIYAEWYANYTQIEAADLSERLARTVGTQNNPILFGTLLVLCIPFIAEGLTGWKRRLCLAGVVLAAALTGSRTAVLALAVMLLGGIWISGLTAAMRRIGIGIALLLVLVGSGSLLSASEAVLGQERVTFLLSRLGIGESHEAQAAINNLSMRRGAIETAMQELAEDSKPTTWLFGRGYMTSAGVGAKVQEGYQTIDNSYVTVLYEHGLLGLGVFLLAFLSPEVKARRARPTLHKWSVPALLMVGISFDFEAHSTFNVVAMASLAYIVADAKMTRRGTAKLQDRSAFTSRSAALLGVKVPNDRPYET